MAGIKLDLKNSGITEKTISEYKEQVENIHKDLHRRANDEKDFVGWIELPTNYDKKEFSRIKKAAKKIKKESDILVVIGIGGSYLGARAVIEALTSSFQNMLTDKQRKYPQILYVGNNLSPNYINELIESPSDLIIVKDNITRDEDDELSEENILFIDSEREDYEEVIWNMFVNNNKTIFNASFANNYNNSWMSVIYTYSGENLRIEKVS